VSIFDEYAKLTSFSDPNCSIPFSEYQTQALVSLIIAAKFNEREFKVPNPRRLQSLALTEGLEAS
jgi:hypothetical protein